MAFSISAVIITHLDHVILFHLQGLGGLVIVDPPAIEEEPEGGDGDANSLAVRLLQLSHQRGLLHPEVDLVAVLAHHLQLDVLRVPHVVLLGGDGRLN